MKEGQGTRQLERGRRPWGSGRALRHLGEGSERLLSGAGQGRAKLTSQASDPMWSNKCELTDACLTGACFLAFLFLGEANPSNLGTGQQDCPEGGGASSVSRGFQAAALS